MLLVLVVAAHACMYEVGVSVRFDGALPIDAPLPVWGSAPEGVVVRDDAGAEVPVVASTEVCPTDDPRVGCLHHIGPVAGSWEPDTTYAVTIAYQGYSTQMTHETGFTTGAYRVTPGTGVPDIDVTVLDRWMGESSCEPEQAVEYTLLVIPASPDPDGLAILRITRTDGHTSIVRVPVRGAPAPLSMVAPEADEDCFTVAQLDGAGTWSAESPVRCAREAGCGGGPAGSLAALMAWAGTLGRRRRASARLPRSR